MLIDVNPEELICLVFWGESFLINHKGKEIDRRLHKKVAQMLGYLKGVAWTESGYTSLPRYQPGEGKDVEIRVRSKNEGGTP